MEPKVPTNPVAFEAAATVKLFISWAKRGPTAAYNGRRELGVPNAAPTELTAATAAVVLFHQNMLVVEGLGNAFVKVSVLRDIS